MKTSDRRAFVNQLVLCLLVTLGGGGAVGLGTVWMRHQISATANANRLLAAQLAEVERRISETEALVEMEQSSTALRQRNAEWRLGFVEITDAQMLHVAEDVTQRLAARANRELFDSGAPAASFRVALGQ